MELPELSLAPSSCKLTLESNSSSESSDTGSSRKRNKTLSDGCFMENNKSLRAHRSIDLQQSNERLPLDWEQCLDLESGKMYFLNRKTMKKSWDRPTAKDHHQQLHHHQRQKLDLELNISSSTPTRSALGINKCSSYMKTLELMGVAQAIHNTRKDDDHHQSSSSLASYSNNKQQDNIMNNSNNNNNNMVAMACMNCHLLVIVSNSNRTCPNCKYVHCIPPAQQISPAPRNPTFKPLDTLSLFS